MHFQIPTTIKVLYYTIAVVKYGIFSFSLKNMTSYWFLEMLATIFIIFIIIFCVFFKSCSKYLIRVRLTITKNKKIIIILNKKKPSFFSLFWQLLHQKKNNNNKNSLLFRKIKLKNIIWTLNQKSNRPFDLLI